MMRTMLLAKLHQARITQTDVNYSGSITIDKDLLDATGMLVSEKVEIFDIDNGNRFATYILAGEAGSGIIGINGAAARLVEINHRVIIVNYGLLNKDELAGHTPCVAILDADNKIKEFK